MINIFVDSNLIFTLSIVISLIIISIIILIVILTNKKKAHLEIENNKKQNDTFLEIFGGEENIVSCEARGSRLVLVLNDYSKLDETRLKENGVTSMIKATNKVTLIIGEKSKELENFINENKRL